MKGGTLDIEGNAGERLGGPLSGETVGMSGGVLHVRGDAGERAGDRLRRGFVLIEGRAGPYAGSRMIAGTLAIGDEAGDLPGYLMGRGTILLGRGASLFSPSFGDCGEHDLVAARLLANYIAQVSASWENCSAGRCGVSPATSPRSARERFCSRARRSAVGWREQQRYDARPGLLEHVFDLVALFVQDGVMGDRDLPVGFRRHAGRDAALGEGGAEPVGVATLRARSCLASVMAGGVKAAPF